VGRSLPFHLTTEAETKFDPFTVRVKAAPPTEAPNGDTEVIAGTAFCAEMVKDTALDKPPPGAGLKTVTCTVPAVARSVAGIAAVN
jgi:hypothetical protein